jgi:hypothetical protein
MSVLVLLVGRTAAAQSFPVDSVPTELKPWVAWVLDQNRDRVCPVVATGAGDQESKVQCVWPGRLALVLDAHGGTFTQEVTADREIAFRLPGDEAHWPQGVTLNGKPVAVLESEGRPQVLLPPGTGHLAGRLAWRDLPESIHIPPTIALVDLSIGGKPIPFPRRDAEGLLWLQAGENAGGEGERLDLDVVRRVADGIPLVVTTRITLRVAGKAREVDLGKVLLDNTIPLSVTGGLPARLEPAGNLRVQLRAGTFTVDVTARTNGSPEALAAPKLPPPWPESETWVWEANDALRQVSVGGAPGVDPSRTSLPEAWRKLPAYDVAPAARLTLLTTRRGVPDPAPDRLALRRQIWMDVDGGGFTFQDHLTGTLSRTWRLDLDADGTLGHVGVGGVDQLITANPDSHRPGVELRDATADVIAEWRAASAQKTLPAVGWSRDVQRVEADLYLPPGWRLVTATGVDTVPGTWISRWNLLGFLFVLLVAGAIGRLTCWWWGALALPTLALCYPEAGSPLGVWLSLLVAAALARVLPQGKVRKVVRVWWWGSVAALVLAVVPFAVDRLRAGMFPQVQGDDRVESREEFGMVAPPAAVNLRNADRKAIAGEEKRYEANEPVPSPDQAEHNAVDKPVYREPNEEKQQQIGQTEQEINRDAVGTTKVKKDNNYRRALQNDPHAVVQTGFGMPVWAWHTYSLGWSGPVTKDHRIHLWLLSPLMNLVLGFLQAILLVLVAVRLVWGESRRSPPPSPPREASGETSGASAAAAAAAVLIGLCVVGAAAPARADVPPPDTLNELRSRLVRPDACRPSCVSNSTLDLRLTGGVLALTAEVHVGAPASWRIPGPADGWVPRTVTVDGARESAIALLEDGFLHVRLAPGRHVVEVSGPAPASDIVTLQLGDAPHFMTAQAPGWKVDGLTEEGRAASSIQLSRELVTGSAPVAEAGYPPWLEIRRTLDIGIPWLVQTTVTRVSPTGAPVVAHVPLLPGESVTESGLRVENGEIVVSLGRDETQLSWSSTLAETPSLTLTAPTGRPWSEVWALSCSPVWRCQPSGLAPTQHQEGNRWQPSFHPWPGETLVLQFQRPDGVAGQSTTIDKADLDVTPGARLQTAVLALDIRSSQGGVQRLTLPAGAEIQELTVDGQLAPIRKDGAVLVLSLRTGLQHVRLAWQQPGGLGPLASVPAVDLGREAVNARVVVHLPYARWLIYVGGPSWGPAVLWWAYLAACLLAALVCGSFRTSPLRSWQWALLALGLAQIPAYAAAIVVAWFFFIEWRRRRALPTAWAHDARQIGLGVWTAAAFVCLYGAVHTGLLTVPDMQVAGAGSTPTALVWYVDRIAGAMPTPWVVSLPMWVWQAVMLAWSLWLAVSLLRWLPWAWRAFAAGDLWRPVTLFRRKRAPATPTAPPTDAPAAPPTTV